MSAPLQLHYQDHQGRRHQLQLDPVQKVDFFIGRHDGDYTPIVNLPWDIGVSRRHARLFYDYNTWFIEHLEAKNQTRVNEMLLVAGVPVELPAEATIRFGKKGQSVLHVRYSASENMPEGSIRASSRRVSTQPQRSHSESQEIELLAHLAPVLAQKDAHALDKLRNELQRLFPSATSGGIALYRDKEIYVPSFFPRDSAQISFRLAREAMTRQAVLHWDRISAADDHHFSSLMTATQALYAPLLRGVRKLGVIFLHTSTQFSPNDEAKLTTFAEIIAANEHFQPETAHLRLPSVFISYAHHDMEFVKRLVDDLRRQRITVWFDERLHAGDEWKIQLTRAIQQSDAFALVMSPESLASEYVQWEINEARAGGKRIFPLWHQECAIVPEGVNRLQRIDLLNDYQHGVLELVEALYGLSGETDKLASESVVMRSSGQGEKTRILFLAANPTDSDPLRLGEEIRTIQERIRGGKYRDRFDTIQQGWAVRYPDLQQYLLDFKPHIVHFSGHGRRSGELMLEDNSGKAKAVSTTTLSLLFKALKEAGNLRLVILNACFSAQQAQVIADEVGCVLGMSRAVSDSGAIEFSGAFYHALTFCQSVQTAYNLAQAAMSQSGEQETLQLLSVNVDPAQFYFCTEEK